MDGMANVSLSLAAAILDAKLFASCFCLKGKWLLQGEMKGRKKAREELSFQFCRSDHFGHDKIFTPAALQFWSPEACKATQIVL